MNAITTDEKTTAKGGLSYFGLWVTLWEFLGLLAL